MKNGDIIIIANDNDDDEMGTSAAQKRATVKLCTEELFL